MRLVVVAFLVTAVFALDANKVSVNGDLIAEFHNEETNLADINTDEEHKSSLNVTKNKYYLFTRKNSNSPQRLDIYNEAALRNSNFDSRKETVLVCHGWLSSAGSEMNTMIRRAYLDKKDVNIIVLDWSLKAKIPYEVSVTKVPDVGQELGQFLEFMVKVTGASFGNMHLVGHSLGAHVVGAAGRYNGGKVARITGLDPAGPLWTNNPASLNPRDAAYVEAIHTNGGFKGAYGTNTPKLIGKINFYPNGGSNQPGCYTNVCSHTRSWQLFAASITYNRFIGTECSTLTQMTLGQCRGNQLAMGNDQLSKTGGSRYYLETTGSYPYYKT